MLLRGVVLDTYSGRQSSVYAWFSLFLPSYSLVGQPLHKREEGSGIMPIRELCQCLAVMRHVQNHTRSWLVRANGRDSHSYNYWTRRSGTWLVSLCIWDSPIILVMTWSDDLIGLHSWLQQVQLAYRHDTRLFLLLMMGLARQTTSYLANLYTALYTSIAAWSHTSYSYCMRYHLYDS